MADRRLSVRRTVELAERRERRRRRLMFTLISLMVLGITLIALYWFVLRDLAVVEIRDLEIRGLDTGTPEGRQLAEQQVLPMVDQVQGPAGQAHQHTQENERKELPHRDHCAHQLQATRPRAMAAS